METNKPTQEKIELLSAEDYIAEIGKFYNNNMLITLSITPEGVKLITATKLDDTFLPVHLEWHKPKNYIG